MARLNQNSRATKYLGTMLLATGLLTASHLAAQAGQTAAAKPPAVDRSAENKHPLTNAEIAERPYSAVFTRPIYPSTDRVQKQFTVSYVYNYAESKYTPAVTLKTAAKSTISFKTPEDALTAFYSTMRNGDYDGWLACWDDDSRAQLEARTKAEPKGKAFWTEWWKRTLTGAQITLVDRIDTVNYVILDAVILDSGGPGKRVNDSELLLFDKGKWVVSNRYSNDNFVARHDGTLQKDKISLGFDLRPLRNDAAGKDGDLAQEDFFKQHTQTQSVTRTVE